MKGRREAGSDRPPLVGVERVAVGRADRLVDGALHLGARAGRRSRPGRRGGRRRRGRRSRPAPCRACRSRPLRAGRAAAGRTRRRRPSGRSRPRGAASRRRAPPARPRRRRRRARSRPRGGGSRARAGRGPWSQISRWSKSPLACSTIHSHSSSSKIERSVLLQHPAGAGVDEDRPGAAEVAAEAPAAAGAGRVDLGAPSGAARSVARSLPRTRPVELVLGRARAARGCRGAGRSSSSMMQPTARPVPPGAFAASPAARSGRCSSRRSCRGRPRASRPRRWRRASGSAARSSSRA